MLVKFQVVATPVAQGSKIAGVTRNGKPYLRESNGNSVNEFRASVRNEARKHCKTPLTGAVKVYLDFRIHRPKSISEEKRPRPSVRPDLDKYTRACLDALTGVAYVDDGQVTTIYATKHYARPWDDVGVNITVGEEEEL